MRLIVAESTQTCVELSGQLTHQTLCPVAIRILYAQVKHLRLAKFRTFRREHSQPLPELFDLTVTGLLGGVSQLGPGDRMQRGPNYLATLHEFENRFLKGAHFVHISKFAWLSGGGIRDFVSHDQGLRRLPIA